MPKFRLVRLQPLGAATRLDILHEDVERQDTSVPVIELEANPNKKYAVTVEVGDLPPKEAHLYLQQAATKLKEFFGDKVLFIPMRRGEPAMAIYDIQEEPDGEAEVEDGAGRVAGDGSGR